MHIISTIRLIDSGIGGGLNTGSQCMCSNWETRQGWLNNRKLLHTNYILQVQIGNKECDSIINGTLTMNYHRLILWKNVNKF